MYSIGDRVQVISSGMTGHVLYVNSDPMGRVTFYIQPEQKNQSGGFYPASELLAAPTLPKSISINPSFKIGDYVEIRSTGERGEIDSYQYDGISGVTKYFVRTMTPMGLFSQMFDESDLRRLATTSNEVWTPENPLMASATKDSPCDCGGYATYKSLSPEYHSRWCKSQTVGGNHSSDDSEYSTW